MNAWGITHRGMVREENQDTFAVEILSEQRCLAVVCDGMGGARAGNVASSMAVGIFMDCFRQRAGTENLSVEELLTSCAAQANEEIHIRSRKEKECYGMGTTMVVAYVEGSKAVIMNEGDSRAYHITCDGVVRVTRDHSLVEDLVMRGDLTPEEARVHPHKNLITRALGVEPELRADLFEIDVQEGDYFLLCSDGLSNVVGDQEMLYEVLHGGEHAECCQRLLDIALNRGAPDNVTIALIQC